MAERPRSERRTGRPSAEGSEALDGHILKTAIRLFTERGYAGTSIEQIAVAAGAGKPTIYRRYSSKEDLFKAVVTAMSRHLLTSAETLERDANDPLATLRSVCCTLSEMTSQQEVTDTYRILIAEAPRFPSLVDHATEAGIQPLEDVVMRLITAAVDAGQIEDSAQNSHTVQALLGLVTGTPLKQALLRQRGGTDEAARKAYFEYAWAMFLRSVARTNAG